MKEYIKIQEKNEKKVNIIRKAGVLLFWLVLWQLAAMVIDNEILLVTPLQMLAALKGLFGKAAFWQTVGMSLGRIALGFAMGMTASIFLAAAASRFVLVKELAAPVMRLCKTVPLAVFVVILLIWWGSSFLAVSVCFLIVLPQLYFSILEGINHTDRKLLEMAEVFEIPGSTRFFYIYRPALKPFINNSLELALGMCWKSGVAAEVIGTPSFSIGEQLYLSKLHLDMAGVSAWAVVIILLSLGFEALVLWLAEAFWDWKPVCGNSREKRDSVFKYSLHIEGLCKTYGALQVLADVNDVYASGNSYYLTSPSGSGKTTLLRILCGLEKADSGRVWAECRETGSRVFSGQCDCGNMCFGMVFQEDRLCEDYSALKNVEMVTGSREQAEEGLKRVLPAETLNKPCRQLSGGQKRRVALVRAMESACDCVLLDEPFTGMDEETRKQAQAYIRERQNGRILIIATH